MLSNCGIGKDSFESPLDSKIKPVNPKGYQPWIFIGRADAEAEAPILWPPDAKSPLIGKDPDAEKDCRQEEMRTTEDEMVGWYHLFNGHELSKLREMVKDREARCTAVGSVQSLSCVLLFAAPWTTAHQASLSITNSQSFLKLIPIESQWCHPTISSSVFPFSSHLQSFPASGSFQMSQFFTSGGQNIGASALASVSNDYSGLISFRIDWLDLLAIQVTLKSLLQHQVQNHQFFGAQLSLWSNSHIHIWLLEKP